MKDLFIIGSGGFAKEVFELSLKTKEYNFKGFIDYEPATNFIEVANQRIKVYKESDFLTSFLPNENLCLAMGIGDPKTIKKVYGKFNEYKFPNIIHPNATFNANMNTIGQGNIITANVVFTVDIKVGNCNIFNLSSTVGHDTEIGDFNVINPSVNISGGVKIGNCNLLGVSSTILQYKTVKDNSIVGASSLVTKDVESNTLVIGIPAKPRT